MDNKTELQKVKAEIESKQEQKETYEKKLVQHQNREKQLKKMASIKERKKRNYRLIERGAILESFVEGVVLCQEIVQNKKRKFYYPARTSFLLDELDRYNFSNSLGDKYPQKL